MYEWWKRKIKKQKLLHDAELLLQKRKENKNVGTNVLEILKVGADWRIRTMWEAERRECRKIANRRRNLKRRKIKSHDHGKSKSFWTAEHDVRSKKSRRQRNIERFRALRMRRGRSGQTQESVEGKLMAGQTARAPSTSVQDRIPSLKGDMAPCIPPCNSTSCISCNKDKIVHGSNCNGTRGVNGEEKVETDWGKKKNEKKDSVEQKDSMGVKGQFGTQLQPEDVELLVVRGRINGRHVQILIDSGATRSFIASDAVYRLGLRTAPTRVLMKLADSSTQLSTAFCPHTRVVLGTATTTTNFTVTKSLPEVDAIFGMDWLTSVNPHIDWPTYKIYLEGVFGLTVLDCSPHNTIKEKGYITVLKDIPDDILPPHIEKLSSPQFWNCPRSSLPWTANSPPRETNCNFAGKCEKSTEAQEEKNSQPKMEKTVVRVQGRPVRQRKSTARSQRQFVTAKKMSKLMEKGEQCFLMVVRPTDEEAIQELKKRGMTQAVKREIMKHTGPAKLKTVEEGKRMQLEKVAEEHRGRLKELLEKHISLFVDKLPYGKPPDRGIEHTIDLEEGAQPVSRPPYRLSPKEQEEMEEQVRDLLAQGLIRPSFSPWGAPILFVPKKDGRWRMCIDYRALNKATIKDKFPLPKIDELLDRLGRARYFSKLDCASGYHQIAVREQDIPKTAFRTNRGHYEFIVMPFGLTNAPATFQRLMNRIFAEEWGIFILVYLDDILIFSEDLESHFEHLEIAMQRLKDAKICGRLHKCELLLDEVEYLGFDVGRNGVRPNKEKVEAIVNWPRPQTVYDVRSVLGLTSYYRKFIKQYSLIAAPLTNLTKFESLHQWTEAEQKSFDQLKVAMATAPVLKLPDFNKTFVLTTDASLVAVGAVLEQDFGHGLQPIAYESKKLSPTESRYSAYERELLGIIWSLGKWRQYLSGQKFIIQTDHSSLRHLPNQPSVNRRIWKWIAILQTYDCEIRHIPGTRNPADALTRRSWISDKQRIKSTKLKDEELVKILRVGKDATDADIQSALDRLFDTPMQSDKGLIHSIDAQYEEATAKLCISKSAVKLQTTLLDKIWKTLQTDEVYGKVIEEMQERDITLWEKEDVKYKLVKDELFIHSDRRRTVGDDKEEYWKRLIPNSVDIKTAIMTELHTVPYSGHPGFKKTLK